MGRTGGQPATPGHLVWQLDHFKNHRRAIRFVQQFQDTLCVFSAPVGQLYTNYEIAVPEGQDRSLIILPNPYAYHDTFNGLPEDSARATGINIIPGELAGGNGLHMLIPLRGKTGRTVRRVPLATGLRALLRHETAQRPFLPVITKGDLRAFDKDNPSLHLHRLLPDRLSGISAMELNGIRRAIRDRLATYLKD